MQAKLIEYSDEYQNPKIKHFLQTSNEHKELVLTDDQISNIKDYLVNLENAGKSNSVFLSDLKDDQEELYGPHCTITIPLRYEERSISNIQEANKLDVLKYVYAGNNQKVKDLVGPNSGKSPADFLVIPENVKTQLIDACKLLANA